MRFKNTLQTASISIYRNKTRSFLTTLGVIIGVSAVILLVSLGNGLKKLVTDTFDSLGSNLLYVAPGEIVSEEGGFNQGAAGAAFTSKFEFEDVDRIKRIGDPVVNAVPVSEATGEVRYRGEKKNTFFVLTTSDYSDIRNTKAEKGRFFTKADNETNKRVVVIGPKLEEDLFGRSSGIGKTITINGIGFEVIGVAESKSEGSFGGPDFDSVVYFPIDVGQKTLEAKTIQYILVKISSEEEIARGKILIERALLKRLDEDDFSVTDQSELIESINTILNAVTGALTGIAAISLLVGGIGIMNIMLVSVTERTKEIGLRKALGATPSDILYQFLLEASVLSGLGGIMGITLGILGAVAIDRFIPAAVTLGSVTLAFSVSVGVGIIFGVFPARKASKLSPIEALRYE